MAIVRMPDGTQVRFPDDMPPEQIKAMILQKFPDAGKASPAASAAATPAAAAPTGESPGMAALRAQFEHAHGDDQPAPASGDYQSPLPGFSSFANGVAESVPVLGPLANRAADAVGSRIASAMTGRPADEELAKGQQRYEDSFKGNEAARTLGNIAGTIGPLGAAGATTTGGKLLGMTGSVGSRAVLGGTSGAVIGGADAAARGENPQAAVNSAVAGGMLGAMAPLGGKLASMGWDAVRNQPAVAGSLRTLSNGLARDRIDPSTINARLADIGPDAVVADLGPNVRSQASALASLPGDAKTTIVDSLTARNDSRNARIRGAIDDTLGAAPVPSRVDAGIQQQMDQFGPIYRALFTKASRVDTTPLAENLEADIVNRRGDAQRALQEVRGMLNVRGTDQLDPNPYTLFQTRQAIDGMLENEPNTKVVQALTDARHQINGILAPAVPGIKEVDAQFEELARQRTGLNQGSRVLGSGPQAAPPGELEDIIAAGVQPKGIGVGPSAEPYRLAQGTRAEIERIVGTTTNDLTALKTALKGDGSWNRDRLAQLYGPERTDQLLGLLDRESTYDLTFNKALRNSETADRTAAQGEMSPAPVPVSTNANATGLMLHALSRGVNAGLAFNKGGTNAAIAKALMAGAGDISPEDQAILVALAQRRARPAVIAPAAVPLLTQQALGQ